MGFDIHFLGLLQISSYYLFEFICSSTFLYTICTPFFPLPQGTNNPPPFFFGAGQNSTFATRELIQGWVDGSAFSHLPHQSRDTGKHSGQTRRQQSERENCEVSATCI